jgi:hypothetical protein
MIDDGTLGLVSGVGTPPLNNIPKSTLGCDTLGNISQDLTGKIAVIYRGSCEYGLKAYNAQKRGAIGVIIINHTGDPITMGGGVYGYLVNIPVVMIGRIAGDDLYLALQNCGSSITGFIGSKIGFYANDMGSSIGEILMPENHSTPILITNGGSGFTLDFGLWSYNFGLNSQTGVTASVVLTRVSDATVIYSQTSLPLDFLAPIGNNILI